MVKEIFFIVIVIFLHSKNVTDLIKKAEDLMQQLSDWLIDNRLSLNRTKLNIAYLIQTRH